MCIFSRPVLKWAKFCVKTPEQWKLNFELTGQLLQHCFNWNLLCKGLGLLHRAGLKRVYIEENLIGEVRATFSLPLQEREVQGYTDAIIYTVWGHKWGQNEVLFNIQYEAITEVKMRSYGTPLHFMLPFHTHPTLWLSGIEYSRVSYFSIYHTSQ